VTGPFGAMGGDSSAPASAGGTWSSLSVYAGTVGSAAQITATLIDGGASSVFTDLVNATHSDIGAKMPYNLKWELKFRVSSPSAVLIVNISATVVPTPVPTPAPAPPPAPCSGGMCGDVTPHTGEVFLSSVGSSDWTHYGLGDSLNSVNRKCNTTSLIHPLKLTNGETFHNCPQTFTWSSGGYDLGTPTDAQVSAVTATPTAVYVSGKVGAPAGEVNFAVDVPTVKATTTVRLYIGACNSIGILTTKLADSMGRVQATYNYTMSTSSCQWTAVATLTIPPVSGGAGTGAAGRDDGDDGDDNGGLRTLTGTWTQTTSDHRNKDTNIQFHAIAVDAGGPVAEGRNSKQRAVAPCVPDRSSGTVVLQAALLE